MYFFTFSLLLLFLFFTCRSRITSLIITLFIPIVIMSIYFSGEDWVNYLDSFELGINISSPEATFYSLLFLLKSVTMGSYEYSILLFYYIVFISIFNLFYNKSHLFFFSLNKYYLLFLSYLFLALGPTLVMEQLRQLLALVLFMYSFSFFSNRRKALGTICMILSVLSHVSAAILFLFIYLCMMKLRKITFAFTIILLCSFILILCAYPILDTFNVPFISFIYDKISRYLSVSVIGFGVLHLCSLFYILYYVLIHNERSVDERYTLIIDRLAFSGSALYLCSAILPFLNRFSSYFIIIYIFSILIFCMSSSKTSNGYIKTTVLMVICMATGISYYRNPISPLPFLDAQWSMSYIFIDNQNLKSRYDKIKLSQLEKMQVYGYE